MERIGVKISDKLSTGEGVDRMSLAITSSALFYYLSGFTGGLNPKNLVKIENVTVHFVDEACREGTLVKYNVSICFYFTDGSGFSADFQAEASNFSNIAFSSFIGLSTNKKFFIKLLRVTRILKNKKNCDEALVKKTNDLVQNHAEAFSRYFFAKVLESVTVAIVKAGLTS